MSKHLVRYALVCALLIAFASGYGNGQASAQAPGTRIYWGNAVPDGWNGKWPEHLRTVAEKTDYARTASSLEVLEYLDVLRWTSEHVHVINMFTSGLRKTGAALVLSNPRVTIPEEARASGKPVVYLQGNIHPPEAEAKEALLMLARDLLFGSRRALLDELVVIVCPNFNVDGNDTWTLRDGTPHLIGVRTNAADFDLNRDAVKLETPEVNGLFRNVLNRWDPLLVYDGHAMGRIRHGYAIVYATSTVPAAHPGPRGYVFETMFPSLREAVRRDFGLETFTHCDFDTENWPPTIWSHDRAIWATEAKFVAACYGLRNRMSILAETPGYVSFERKIYAQYALTASILEHTARHGREMMRICAAADAEVVAGVESRAAAGTFENFTEGKYESWGPVEILAYRSNEADYVPGTSVRAATEPGALGPPERIPNVQHLTKPVGTRTAKVPRGYLLPAGLGFLAEKLRTHNVRVDVLDRPVRADGEAFAIDRVVVEQRWSYPMIRLEGGFAPAAGKEFPAGTFRVDLAQPLANLAFYLLEPQAADGFVGWNVLADHLPAPGGGGVYPVFKYFKIAE